MIKQNIEKVKLWKRVTAGHKWVVFKIRASRGSREMPVLGAIHTDQAENSGMGPAICTLISSPGNPNAWIKCEEPCPRFLTMRPSALTQILTGAKY